MFHRHLHAYAGMPFIAMKAYARIIIKLDPMVTVEDSQLGADRSLHLVPQGGL